MTGFAEPPASSKSGPSVGDNDDEELHRTDSQSGNRLRPQKHKMKRSTKQRLKARGKGG